MGRLQSRTFVWRFDSPPGAVWPALADTVRVNECAGLPKHTIEEQAEPDGSVRFIARTRKGPIALEWEEIPVEWVASQWFRHERVFTKGPLRSLIATLRLEPDGSGAIGRYTLEASARTLLGRATLATGFFPSAQRTFTHLADLARDWAAGRRASAFEAKPIDLEDTERRRLAGIVESIEASGNGHGLAPRLADHLISAMESELTRLRPLELSAAWGCATRDAIELCLQGVVDGLLDLRWDLLCPRCRGAKMTTPSLDRLPTAAHCGSCNIAYDRDYARNVEVTFRPAAWLRPITDGEFCLFGPMSTPHIRAQLAVEAGGTREQALHLPPGDYRLRTLEIGGECDIALAGGALPTVVLADGTVSAGDPAPLGTLRLINGESRRRTVVIEDRTWQRDALTGDRVIALQAFRDLFPDTGFRPGDEAAISQVALMFTDLKSSTALYERIGDASAYALVRAHYRFLIDHIRAHDGGVVKTIGDAVMAVFAEPRQAAAAALAIQRSVATFNRDQPGEPLSIKLGLHAGPCVAVTLNGRLDYFGQTVNMAARLQGQSAGGDIVLSGAVRTDAGVSGLLQDMEIREDQCSLKGVAEPVAFYRIPSTAFVGG